MAKKTTVKYSFSMKKSWLKYTTIYLISLMIVFTGEYIFPRPRKVSPRDGTEVKTCFICRGKVSFSAVVEKKDSCLTERSSCLTDRSSCLPERSEGRQRREVRQRSEVRQSFWAETKEKETFSRQRKWSDRTVSIPGILTFIAGGYIFFR